MFVFNEHSFLREMNSKCVGYGNFDDKWVYMTYDQNMGNIMTIPDSPSLRAGLIVMNRN